jgi:hypothetical protein
VLHEYFDARLDRIRAPDLLKLSGNAAGCPPGIITAIAADQLVLLGAIVVRPEVEDTAWPFPEAERPFVL